MLFPSHTTTYKLKLSQYTTTYTLMLMKGLVKFRSPQTLLELHFESSRFDQIFLSSQKCLTLFN